MSQRDARKQNRQAHCERRRQVVSLYEAGMPIMKIVATSGLSWYAVNTAIKLFQANGESGLFPSARGRKQGTGRILAPDQEAKIRTLILKQRPIYYGLKKSVWDCTVVQQLISSRCGMSLSLRVVNNYLRRWGLTETEGSRRQKFSVTTRQSIDQNYKDIVQEAKEMDAEIFWLMVPKPIDGEYWRPTPASETGQSERGLNCSLPQKLSMIAARNKQGKIFWIINRGRFTRGCQSKFIEALLRDTKKEHLYLIRHNTRHYDIRAINQSAKNERGVRIKIFP